MTYRGLDEKSQKIISRFNKSINVRNLFDDINIDRFNKLQQTIKGFSSKGFPLLEFHLDDKNFTYVTDRYLLGCKNGNFYSFAHSLSYFEYEFWSQEERLKSASELLKADFVSINGHLFFWLPTKAILPFANLLNFLREGKIR